MMGFPAGWTDPSVPSEKLAMVPKRAKQVGERISLISRLKPGI